MLSVRYLIEEVRSIKYAINASINYDGTIINIDFLTNKIDNLLSVLMKEHTSEKNARKKIIAKKKREKEKMLKKQIEKSEQKKYNRLLNIDYKNVKK